MLKIANLVLESKMGFRKKFIYLRRLCWAQKKIINKKEEDILSKYCGIKRENFRYDPNNTNEDYYI